MNFFPPANTLVEEQIFIYFLHTLIVSLLTVGWLAKTIKVLCGFEMKSSHPSIHPRMESWGWHYSLPTVARRQCGKASKKHFFMYLLFNKKKFASIKKRNLRCPREALVNISLTVLVWELAAQVSHLEEIFTGRKAGGVGPSPGCHAPLFSRMF